MRRVHKICLSMLFVLATLVVVPDYASAMTKSEEDAIVKDLQERNKRFQNYLINGGWSHGTDAQYFGLVDINNDGIEELIVNVDDNSKQLPGAISFWKNGKYYGGYDSWITTGMCYCPETGYLMVIDGPNASTIKRVVEDKFPITIPEPFDVYAQIFRFSENSDYGLECVGTIEYAENGNYIVDGKEVTSKTKKAEIDAMVKKYMPTKILLTTPYKVTKKNLDKYLPLDKSAIRTQLKSKCAFGHTYKTTTSCATQSKDGSVVKQCSVCKKGTKTIVYKANKISLSKKSYTYTGTSLKPAVTIKDCKGKKISKKYYTVTYSNNKKVGTATVTIKFKGLYKGTVKKTFTIKPKTTEITKITIQSKGFKLNWKKQLQQTTGYQIQYSTDKKFTNKKSKSVVVKNNSSASKTIKNLTSGKKYYVRVRTYKTIKSQGKVKTMYSSWSKVQLVKVK